MKTPNLNRYAIPEPVANGWRTDHPIPNLPFVDDSVLNDLSDRHAIEALGRHRRGMWGRTDSYRPAVPKAWVAFTTDPTNHAYGWLVVHHPKHGTSVSLYRSEDIPAAHGFHLADHGGVVPLVVRAGGFWGDGQDWRRPTRLYTANQWDPAWGANTIRVSDRIALHEEFPPFAPLSVKDARKLKRLKDTRWDNQLRAWAEAKKQAGGKPLDGILDVETPDLEPQQLLSLKDALKRGGVDQQEELRKWEASGLKPTPQRYVQRWFSSRFEPRWSPDVITYYYSR